MVMENEIRLGDVLERLVPSDRLVIYNGAQQVIYRGYAANALHSGTNTQRRVKRMGLGMETYRATEKCGTGRKQTACRSRCQLNNSHNTGWKTCNTFCISELN